MSTDGAANNLLHVRRLGLDTQHEVVVLMHKDCAVCRSEGFSAHARVRLTAGDHSIIGTLYQVTSDLVRPGEVGLSEAGWRRLALEEGATVSVSHPRPVESLSHLRSKVYGNKLPAPAVQAIVDDVVAGRYSDIHLSSFVTACTAVRLDHDEIVALTRAMVDVGERQHWSAPIVADKHSVGGLPGNRTTPIVVAIVAAAGIAIPKTSSRAITSPAGTADAMETLAPVDLDITAMRRVVECEGGCIIWGGSVRLSPADDTLIRVERALDLDSEGQLVASVLSKKVAAGATHLVLDLPVGPTAKVRTPEAAGLLSRSLEEVAAEFGLTARAMLSDGSQPVGRGIGPAPEARDVLAVLRNEPDAPMDLRDRAVGLSGTLLELAHALPSGEGAAEAARLLREGRAWDKFQRICEAQGGMRVPPMAGYRRPILAERPGRVGAIDNRRLARAAKLAGAPDAKAAGLELHIRLRDLVQAGQPLFTVLSESPGELAYALAYVQANPDIVQVEES